MKKAIVIILILAVVLGALSLVKNVIANAAVSTAVKAITGLTLQMRHLSVGIVRTSVGVSGMRLFNPSGFPERVMVDMPELYVDYDLPAFFKGKVHLEKVRVYLKELAIVKNEKGELNLDSLKVVQAGNEKKEPSQKKEKGKMPEMRIDLLELKIDKVVYKDYSGGTPPQVTEFNVNINEKYQNISNPYALGSIILSRALFNTTIASLTNFDVKALEGQLKGALTKYTGDVTGTLMKTTATTREVGQKAAGSAKEVAGSAKDAVEETAGALKKLFR